MDALVFKWRGLGQRTDQQGFGQARTPSRRAWPRAKLPRAPAHDFLPTDAHLGQLSLRHAVVSLFDAGRRPVVRLILSFAFVMFLLGEKRDGLIGYGLRGLVPKYSHTALVARRPVVAGISREFPSSRRRQLQRVHGSPSELTLNAAIGAGPPVLPTFWILLPMPFAVEAHARAVVQMLLACFRCAGLRARWGVSAFVSGIAVARTTGPWIARPVVLAGCRFSPERCIFLRLPLPEASSSHFRDRHHRSAVLVAAGALPSNISFAAFSPASLALPIFLLSGDALLLLGSF